MSPLRERGHTLVELIGAFGVAAAVVSMGIPAVRHTIETARLRSGAWRLVADLHALRTKGVATRSERELSLQSSPGEACRYVLRVPGATEGEVRTLAGVRCEGSPQSSVRFGSRGLASLPGTIVVRNGPDRHLRVEVRATGRAEIVP